MQSVSKSQPSYNYGDPSNNTIIIFLDYKSLTIDFVLIHTLFFQRLPGRYLLLQEKLTYFFND